MPAAGRPDRGGAAGSVSWKIKSNLFHLQVKVQQGALSLACTSLTRTTDKNFTFTK